MENSMNSMNKCSICSDQRTSESPEESGWTMYFEDFSVKNSREQYTYCSSGFETSSLVSDAANSLAGKRSDRSERGGSFSMAESSKRSSFKKRKTKGAFVDHDALEDTATSPLNSTTPEVKAVRISGKLDERSTEVVGFVERDYCDCAGLKKRGLCLVPLSRIMNYFG